MQEQRIERILTLLAIHGFRTNQALAQDLDVSEMTIRRDLNELSDMGKVKRVRGGVRLIRRADGEQGAATESQLAVERAIADTAADTVLDGDTIYLDNGPIAVAIARVLMQRQYKGLRVVTNSVFVGAILCNDSFAVIQLGGEIHGSGAVVGQQATRFMEAMRFDRCFLCADGFNVDFGVSGQNLPEIEVKRAAMQHSTKVCLVADSGLWNKQSMLRIANLRDFHAIFTDSNLPTEAQHDITSRGLELHMADDGFQAGLKLV